MVETRQFFRKRYGDAFIDDLSTWQPKKSTGQNKLKLTGEQEALISNAMLGKNVLVDACVGSGKTTTIQALCNALPGDKKILYMTYSKLLKLDARAKIRQKNVTVTNYHGFAYMILKNSGVSAGIGELVQKVIRGKYRMPHYDVLVLDEYQDLELETATLVNRIKEANPGIQIIAVGDMKQKIQDKTTLDVAKFIDEFLGDHITLTFTNCFRLCEPHAQRLSYMWQKSINGVNKDCHIAIMRSKEVVEFLGAQEPKDILCLGQRSGGIMNLVLNDLEEFYPEKYNKSTIFASIRNNGETGSVNPNEDSGIFTTYDGAKGLERKICVLFDFTPSYWLTRTHQPDAKAEIIRNIFMVAASRGKELIIFVEDGEKVIDDNFILDNMTAGKEYGVFNISEMFDFKYKEDVEECYNMLNVDPIAVDMLSDISISSHDELIDLSPCIGIYQEALFFDGYNIDKEFELLQKSRPDSNIFFDPNEPLDKKVLRVVAIQTRQNRYIKQVHCPYVSDEQKKAIEDRLLTMLSRSEDVQKPCTIRIKGSGEDFEIVGIADVVRPNRIYELKFTSELQHTAFLQCACYLLAFNIEKGTVWNVRTNEMFEVSIKNRDAFLKQVVKTITRGRVKNFNADYAYSLDMTKKAEKVKIPQMRSRKSDYSKF